MFPTPPSTDRRRYFSKPPATKPIYYEDQYGRRNEDEDSYADHCESSESDEPSYDKVARTKQKKDVTNTTGVFRKLADSEVEKPATASKPHEADEDRLRKGTLDQANTVRRAGEEDGSIAVSLWLFIMR